VGRVHVVQRVDDVHRDVCACAAAGFPDRGARRTNEQVRGAGRFSETVRRADDRIVAVHDGVPREVVGEPHLLDEVCQRFQLAAHQAARIPHEARHSAPARRRSGPARTARRP
jgi:hypothetical protein